MKPLIFGLLALVALPAAQGKQTFTGTITDSECSNADHSHMQMGPTDAECTVACVDAHGASYVLYDGKETYALTDQAAAAKFPAKKVNVTGTLDGKSIKVDKIEAAK